jgi:hypothetical protein
MDIGINLKKISNTFKWSNLKKAFFEFLFKRGKALVFLVAILGTAYCVYIWNIYIYKPGWNDAQKQDYIKKQNTDAVFNKTKFESAVTKAQARQAEFQKTPDNLTDIFRLKQ